MLKCPNFQCIDAFGWLSRHSVITDLLFGNLNRNSSPFYRSCCQFSFINPLDWQLWHWTGTATRGAVLSQAVPYKELIGTHRSHTCQAAGSGCSALPEPVCPMGLISILWQGCCPGWLHWHGIQGAATPLTAASPQLNHSWDSRAVQASQCPRGSHNSVSEPSPPAGPSSSRLSAVVGNKGSQYWAWLWSLFPVHWTRARLCSHRQCVSMAEPGDESSRSRSFCQPVLGAWLWCMSA